MIDFTARLEALAAAPKTHRVTTHYASGAVSAFDAHSANAAASIYASESRKIGRDLIDRATGDTVRVVSVVIEPLV